MKLFEFWLKFEWSLFLRVQLTIFQLWFRLWLDAVQATSHYLNQWWLVYWCIYASLGLDELTCCWACIQGYMIHYIWWFVQVCSKSIADTLELLQSCTKPSISSGLGIVGAAYTKLLYHCDNIKNMTCCSIFDITSTRGSCYNYTKRHKISNDIQTFTIKCRMWNLFSSIPVHIENLNLVITVPTDVIAHNRAKPSPGTI